eukprot:SAG11_NODE_1292_length_5285_cov_9.364057_2_plen_66_part_00
MVAALLEAEPDSEMVGPTEDFVERLRIWLERKRIFDPGGGPRMGSWEKIDENRSVEASCSICHGG